MKADLQKARELLQKEGYTCVLCKGEQVCASVGRGVKPLLDWLEENPRWEGFCAADRVVGRAAAFLYLHMGIECLYAGVISQPALEVLERHRIPCQYGRLVPAIRNRTGEGFCPMESAVLEISDPLMALEAIKKKLRQLQSE